MSTRRVAFVLLWSALCIPGQARMVVREWTAEELAEWSGGLARKVGIQEGGLVIETAAGDSMWTGPVFEGFAARAWQTVELTMQSDVAGRGVLFWTGTTETKHGGFSGEKNTGFEVSGDGEFHTYRIEPFWQAERKILRMRLDFPEQTGGRYAIRSLRIVEEGPADTVTLPVQDVALDAAGRWRARVALKAEDWPFVTLRLAVKEGDMGALSFVASKANGLRRVRFPLRADGRMHSYNVDVGAEAGWSGEIIGLGLDLPSSAAAGARVESIAAGVDAQGGPDLEVRWLGLADPWARAGRPVRLEAVVTNHGGEVAKGIQPRISLRGARLIQAEPVPDAIEFEIPRTLGWTVQADEPGSAEATLVLDGAKTVAALAFREPVSLPPAAYVPEPVPAQSDYLVGAYVYPGWNTASAWGRLRPYPERQPLLGWYREELPEVADWQIKWAVEHGISFFLYDWYWDRGRRHHEHGLHSALFHARYQNLIQFCLLYANHNQPGSHSAEDFEAMTQFWLENYFQRPNYLRIEGKPVVVMFAPTNPARDMGVEAVKTSFEKMRAICREAGVGGLYLVACMPPEAERVAGLRELGYDAVTAYNWPRINMTEEETALNRASFASCVEGYGKAWREIAAAGDLKLIPPVCGGWDARPWHGESTLVRTGRTPALFREHLEDCKRFLDKEEQDPKLKMLFVEAWNEWGEGSYIEPHREFGFGYLEAIRQVFAPGSPKPAEIVPADLGLGPYDIGELPEVTSWDFSKAADALGWSGNVERMRVESGALAFTTRGHDPILSSPVLRVRASRFPAVTLRIKSSRDLAGQLFWKRLGSAMSEASSLRFPISGDGQFHDITVRTGESLRWRGIITELRVDPGQEDGAEVAIESIALTEDRR